MCLLFNSVKWQHQMFLTLITKKRSLETHLCLLCKKQHSLWWNWTLNLCPKQDYKVTISLTLWLLLRLKLIKEKPKQEKNVLMNSKLMNKLLLNWIVPPNLHPMEKWQKRNGVWLTPKKTLTLIGIGVKEFLITIKLEKELEIFMRKKSLKWEKSEILNKNFSLLVLRLSELGKLFTKNKVIVLSLLKTSKLESLIPNNNINSYWNLKVNGKKLWEKLPCWNKKLKLLK